MWTCIRRLLSAVSSLPNHCPRFRFSMSRDSSDVGAISSSVLRVRGRERQLIVSVSIGMDGRSSMERIRDVVVSKAFQKPVPR